MQRSTSQQTVRVNSRGSVLLPPLSPLGGKSLDVNVSLCRAEVEFFTIVRRGSWNELGAYCRLSLLRDCAVHHTQWSHFTPHCQLWVIREIARIATEGVDDAASECSKALEPLRLKNLVKADPSVASELCELLDSSLGFPKLADRFRKEIDAHAQSLARTTSGSPRSGRLGTMSLTLSSSRPLSKTAPITSSVSRSPQGSQNLMSTDPAPRRRGRGRQEEQAGLTQSTSAPNLRRSEKLAPLRKTAGRDVKGHHAGDEGHDDSGNPDSEGACTTNDRSDIEDPAGKNGSSALSALLRDHNPHSIYCNDNIGNKIAVFDVLMSTKRPFDDIKDEETKQAFFRRRTEELKKATSGEKQEETGMFLTTFNLLPSLGNEGRDAKARELRRQGCLSICRQVLEKLKVRRDDLLPLLEESFLDEEVSTDVVWEAWKAQQEEMEQMMASFCAGSTEVNEESTLDMDAECNLLSFSLREEEEEDEDDALPEMTRQTVAEISHMARYIREVMLELENVFKPGDSKCCQDLIDELACQALRMRVPRVMIDRIRRRLEVGTDEEHKEWQEKEADRIARENAEMRAKEEAKKRAQDEEQQRLLEEERRRELEEEENNREIKEARAKKAAENAAKKAEKEARVAATAAERDAEKKKEEEYKAKAKEAADAFLADKGLESVHTIHESGRPALLIAAAEGDAFLVEAILLQGADIRAARSVDGAGPLHEAAENGQFGNFEVLLKAGCTLEAQTNSGDRPIHFAAGSGSVETLEALKAAGAKVNAKSLNERMALFNAAAKDQVDAAEWLLANGQDVNGHDNDGTMPIHVAAAENAANMVEWLIAKGVDAGVKDGQGQTAKQIATKVKAKKVLKVLSH